jgi:hypothetical protein
MKTSSVLSAAALLIGAVLAEEVKKDLGYVVKTVYEAKIEVRVDDFGFTVLNYQPIPSAKPTVNELAKRACAKNNCLRALISRTAIASPFCATYTTAASTGVGPFTQCENAAKLSSACSCQYAVSRLNFPHMPLYWTAWVA